jgi:hypothetical protein
MNRRREVTIGAVFAIIRFVAFAMFFSRQSVDAQWQLIYLPLWAADFPLSLLYRFLPFPLPEAILGPLWWFCIGFVTSPIIKAGRRRFNKS